MDKWPEGNIFRASRRPRTVQNARACCNPAGENPSAGESAGVGEVIQGA